MSIVRHLASFRLVRLVLWTATPVSAWWIVLVLVGGPRYRARTVQLLGPGEGAVSAELGAVRGMSAAKVRAVRALALAVSTVLVGQLLTVPPAAAAPAGPPGAPGTNSVSVSKAPGPGQAKAPKTTNWQPAPVSWPSGEGDVTVGGPEASVGGLPVSARSATVAHPNASGLSREEAPAAVRIRVTSRDVTDRAQVRGVIVSVAPTTTGSGRAPVTLELGYAPFRDAFGGDYAGRLRLVSLPGCVLTTPEKPACQVQKPLPSVNHQGKQTVTATVPVVGETTTDGDAETESGPAVLALAAGTSSPGATYEATSLTPSYSWAAGNQGGSFTYNYPLKTPASLGGPAPRLSLNYDSGAVDAQTLAQNGQSSMVGEGWNLQTGFIERSYRPCRQDGRDTGDLCWFSYNATMVFNGRSTQLIRDDATLMWHAADDSGLLIEQLAGAPGGPGDNGTGNREYWKVTTLDGTQYYFGANKRFAGDGGNTWSTLNVPVISNNPGEPCAAQGWCQMAYRWNLDYVVDARGNSMTYTYIRWNAAYGASNNFTTLLYDMGSVPDRVEYGTRAGQEGSGNAPMRVYFGYTDRCLGSCTHSNADFPDTPWDQYCAPGSTSCPTVQTPVFWIPWKLQYLATQLWTGSGYRHVDQWDFGYDYPPSGDGTSPNLWLGTLRHAGFSADGASWLGEPLLCFESTPMANRKNYGTDIGVAPYKHHRIVKIHNGVGGETLVSYNATDCARESDPTPDANRFRCFPQYFTSVDKQSAFDWFNKYTVAGVREHDTIGGSPDEVWGYDYSTDGSSETAMWGHDTNETVQLAYRTWSKWQGYATVKVTHGAFGAQTVTKNLYHRGFDRDGRLSQDGSGVAWTARRVSVTGPIVTGATAAVSGSGKCVDIAAYGTANGTKVQSYDCSADWNQVWQLQSDGMLKNPTSGRCLDIVNRGTAAGSLVQLWDCGGAANQIWQPQSDGRLKNPVSGRCLDIPSASTSNGVQLQINDCTGTAQRWSHNIALDSDSTQGSVREQTSYDGATPVTSNTHVLTVNQTAARAAPARDGQPLFAHMALETQTQARSWIAATNSWRSTRVDTSYDEFGLARDVNDIGDTAVGGDDRCTHTDYARDTGRRLIDFPSQVITTTCAATPADADYLAGSQTFYDNATTIDATPSKGLATKTTALASVSAGTRTWKQSGRSDYDAYGRVIAAYDPLDRKTMTTFTPSTGGPVTATTVINTLGWSATTTVDPGKGTPTTVSDVNAKTTVAEYDQLARLTKVWLNNRPKTGTPDKEYSYDLRGDAASSVTTRTLGPNGNQITSYAIFDGRLRPRQAQTPAPEAVGGRVITDTAYDGRGLKIKASTFWNNTAGPSSTLVAFADADVANQHRYTYDNLERQTVDGLYSRDAVQWQSVSGYDGDRVTVTQPAGGTATTAFTNARGKTSTLRQYLGDKPSSAFQDTTYGYDRLDRQTSVKDPVGNEWTTTYDLRGRATRTTDPDKGVTASTYDDAGQVLTTKDARTITLAYSYDPLGRKTGEYQDSTSGTKLAGWTYDTLTNGAVVKGQPATSTRYAGADAYSSLVVNYDDAYRPLGATVRIPSAEGGLVGDWTSSTTYNVDGSPKTLSYPPAGGLAAEIVTYRYDSTGLPLAMSGQDTYVADTSYYYWGAIKQRLLGTAPKQTKIETGYTEATGRLALISTSTQSGSTSWAEKLTESYTYNPAGLVTSIAETSNQQTVSNQCFTYDGLAELTEAWTTTAAACQGTPAQAAVGGPDPYWSSYSYDKIGNRVQDVVHQSTGNTIRDYTYPAATAAQPHAVQSVTASGASTGTSSYVYDATGNTTTREVAGKPGQTLIWDLEGHLGTLADSSGTASYLYDASGARLISRDSTGSTLYLGTTEIHQDNAGAVTANRFYGDCAVRTSGGGLSWLAADHHATGQLSINAGDLSVNRRKSDPFGNPRGTQPSWPTNHGYVNGITDPTGLTHLGAREYDPGIGRFISVDPILDLADPVQMNGYNYANNSPVSSTDPSGLRTCSDPTDCAGDPTKGNPGYGNGATEESSVPGYHKPRTSTGNGRGKGSGKGRGGWKDAGCHSVSCSIHPRTKEEERAANHFAARIGSWLPFLDVAFLYWERELYEEEGNKKAVTETDDLIMTTELLGAGLVPGGAVL